MPEDNQPQQDDAKVIALDFDKTVATHDSGKPYSHEELGEPIPEMVNKVKNLLSQGRQIVIFTARVNPGNSYQEQMMATESYLRIAAWCEQVFGQHFPITYAKSKDMAVFYDDRAKEVIPNEGIFVEEAFPPVIA